MEKDEKPIIKFLFDSFSPFVKDQIGRIRDNFPVSTEDETKFNDSIYYFLKFFTFYDSNIYSILVECHEIAKMDVKYFIPKFLRFFSRIPLDMKATEYEFPGYFDGFMKQNSSMSYSYRCSAFYISTIIVTTFFYDLTVKFDSLKPDELSFVFKSLNDYLFQNVDDENSFRLLYLFVSKFSQIFYYISKVNPDLIFTEAFSRLQNIQTQKKEYQIFLLRLHSSIRYPPTIVGNINTLNGSITSLISLLTSNKSSFPKLLSAGDDFLRNFLGFLLPLDQTSESLSLIKDIGRMYGKIQNEHFLCNSTLVLFSTLCSNKQITSYFSYNKFISSLQRVTLNQCKACDLIKTFTAYLCGSNYAPPFQCELTGENYKWRPNSDDNIYLLKEMCDKVLVNKTLFISSPQELTSFFCQIVALNFDWFNKNVLNQIIDEFFFYNSSAVLQFAITILSPRSNFLKIFKTSETLLQFEDQMRKICNQIFETKSSEISNAKPLTFITNSFTESPNIKNLIDEIVTIADNTCVFPLNEPEPFPIFDYLQEWKNLIQGNIYFDNYINNIDEKDLKTFEYIPNTDDTLIKALTLHFFSLHQNIDHFLNKIPLFLFSDSPVVSAFTVRLLQAYVHITRNCSTLENLLTLQIQHYEQLYIFGLAILRVVESMDYCKIKLESDLSASVFAWQCVFIAAPYINIREIGFMLAEAIVPILPSDAPNFSKFIHENSDEISFKAISKFISFFSYDNIINFQKVSLRDVSRTSSYLLFHVFFSVTFSLFYVEINQCSPVYQKILHALVITLINAKPLTPSLLTNIADCHFVINLMTLRLITISALNNSITSQNIISMMLQGKRILKVLNNIFRINLSFFTSINPSLNITPFQPTNGMKILVLCYTVRQYQDTLSIETIEHNFRKVVMFMNEKNIIRNDIFEINTKDLHDAFDGYLPMALCHMMVTLKNVFKKLSNSFTLNQNNGVFLRSHICSTDENHPFDPEIWFPFLFNITIMPPLQFPFLTPVAYQATSYYCMFNPIPTKFAPNFISICTGVNVVDLYTSILQTSSLFTLDFFISKATENQCFFISICQCFKKPNTAIKDLSLLFNSISPQQETNENDLCDFDSLIYRNIGSLLASATFYICQSNGEFREYAFRLIYHISLFAVSQGWLNAFSLLPILENIGSCYINRLFPVARSQLLILGKQLCNVFHSFCEQFLNRSIDILKSRTHTKLFVDIIAPWFGNVIIGRQYGIVPNNHVVYFTSHSFVKKVLTMSFRKGHNSFDVDFTRSPLSTNSEIIFDMISKSNPLYFIDFILSENQSAKPLLIFLALKYQDIAIPYLFDYLHFDYAFYQVVKKQNIEEYVNVIKNILSVIYSLLDKNYFILSKQMHILFVFCYVNHASIQSKIEAISQKILLFYKVQNFEDCIDYFDEAQTSELINETFHWMISFPRIEEATKAIGLLSKFSRISHNQKNDIITTIKTLCAILSRSNKINNYFLYCKYISKLLQLLDKINSIPIDLVVDILNCNSKLFYPLFECALSIFMKHITSFSGDFNSILYSLITAELSENNIDDIFQIIISLNSLDSNIDKNSSFFALIPYIASNNSHIDSHPNSLCNQIFGGKAEIISEYAKTYEIKDIIKEKEEIENPLTKKFEELMNEIIDELSGDQLYLLISFFMEILRVSDEKYFKIIYAISIVFLRKSPNELTVSPSVFTSLAKYVIKFTKSTEVCKFIRIFQPFDTVILPSRQSKKSFPNLLTLKDYVPQFYESYPSFVMDKNFADCQITEELKNRIFNIKLPKFENREKKYLNSKNQIVISQNFPRYQISYLKMKNQIQKSIQKLKGKNVCLNKLDIEPIKRVKCDVFRVTATDIDSIFE
ncbi:hypothetical protein TRFO_01819 [Tritrichomonas foetus]|uniref:Uncharacterized protein n=1 Tax=Tritrichomonas foetus TaxID=1144522 RepID=A0A1J4JHY0_9EUKA|nr:hypothetical protein TRFO_01819 [Tritrichomonas foetus]|eukprot:OHS98776.1 hypothetical protein TRFO_01819 [Tritrichomonas foetus]